MCDDNHKTYLQNKNRLPKKDLKVRRNLPIEPEDRIPPEGLFDDLPLIGYVWDCSGHDLNGKQYGAWCQLLRIVDPRSHCPPLGWCRDCQSWKRVRSAVDKGNHGEE
jgi:hypothetical protein